jgi:hypothetical protein
MDEVPINIDERPTILVIADDVGVPELIVECLTWHRLISSCDLSYQVIITATAFEISSTALEKQIRPEPVMEIAETA